jgi:hypothetical protein
MKIQTTIRNLWIGYCKEMKILKQVRENELVFKNRMIYGNSIAAECHNNNNTVNPSGV